MRKGHRLCWLACDETTIGRSRQPERHGQRLYLVFNNEQVIKLATYFGLVPLAGILIVLYLGAWLAYRMSRRAVSSVIWLAEEVDRLDPRAPDSNIFAAELLITDPALNDAQRQSAEKIKYYANEMEDLVNVFLLLARESSADELQQDLVCINDVVSAQLQQAQLLAGDKPIEVETLADGRLMIRGSIKILSILIGNLIRNAFSYTDAGRVLIVIKMNELLIEDSGIGIPEQQVQDIFRPYFRGDRRRGGHGVGLTIVKRLSDQFNWPVNIDSKPGIGTRVVVQFPAADYRPYSSQ